MRVSDVRPRRLVAADAPAVHALTGGFGLTPELLRRELAADGDFRWAGLDDPAGRLCAVHRSLRWGPYLFLKGVYVREDVRGSGAAVQLAFALRDAARAEGLPGVAAWFEPGMPESAIAELLGLRRQAPMVHRFALPLAPSGGAAPTAGAAAPPPLRGELELPRECAADRSAAVDQFGAPADGPLRVHWVLDGRRLVASAGFGADRDGLAALLAAFGPLAAAHGAETLEFPVRASDIIGVLQLMHGRAERRNRVPVCLGALSFAQREPGSPPC